MGLPPEVKKAFEEHFAPRLFDLIGVADGIIERFLKAKGKRDRLAGTKTDFRDRVIVAQMLITMSMQGALVTLADVKTATDPAAAAPVPLPEPQAEQYEALRKAFLGKMLERDVNFTNWRGAEDVLVTTDEGRRFLTALLSAAAAETRKRPHEK